MLTALPYKVGPFVLNKTKEVLVTDTDARERYDVLISQYVVRLAVKSVQDRKASSDVVALVNKIGEAFIEGVYEERITLDAGDAAAHAKNLLKAYVELEWVKPLPRNPLEALTLWRLKDIVEEL
jgi:histone H3/H4